MSTKQHDLIVIGGGPAGYVAAIRAAQAGLDAACVDANPSLGGTCLRVGCIPSKALLQSSERYVDAVAAIKHHGIKIGKAKPDIGKMLDDKDKVVSMLGKGIVALFKKHKIAHYIGRGALNGPGGVTVTSDKGDKTELKAKHIIIATGSVSAVLPGIELDGDRIGASTEALSYPDVPKHLAVIGGGYIGLELGSVWKRFGADVTVIEYLDHILPGVDREVAKEAFKRFERQGITFKLGTKVTGARADGDHAVVETEGNDPIECDRVLVAVGRKPTTEGLNIESVGIKLDSKGFVPVDDRFQTSAKGVYAIGDVIGGAMLAHKAEEEGAACVEQIVHGHSHMSYDIIPAVVYTHPEIASVGRTQEQLDSAGTSYRKGIFQFRANGRAQSMGDVDGFVKVLADQSTDRVLGVHIIGPRAGDLIAEATAAMAFGASSEDIARTCHAHPTLSEALKEAAMAVSGSAIHG